MTKLKKYLIKDKEQIILSLLILFGIFGILLWHYLSPNTDPRSMYIGMASFFLAAAFLAFDWKIPKKLSYAFLIIIPTLDFDLMQKYFRPRRRISNPSIYLTNVAILLVIALILFFIIGRLNITLMALTILTMLVGLINYFVIDFREIPVQPIDIFSFSTALSVGSNYDIILSKNNFLTLLKALLLLIFCSRLDLKIKKVVPRISGIVLLLIISVIGGHTLQNKELQEKMGLRMKDFHPEKKCGKNGYPLYFLNELAYVKAKVPEVYDTEEYKELQNTYIEKAATTEEKNITPNIVVIMNESFSDIGILGELKTSEDYMPFVHSIMDGKVENSVYGNCYASVVGGNTANSEYEFLTGNSLCALPENCIPYQLYVNHEIPSMATALEAYNEYNTLAGHCFDSGNWNRKNVYPDMHFDEISFKDEMHEEGYVDLENSNTLIRRFISDQTVVEYIIDRYKKKDNTPDFTFYVTMQNHGGYNKKYNNFTPDISVLNFLENASDEEKFCSETYVSLIKRSDTAFKTLVDYLSDYDEPTIVLMFGDHQPSNDPIVGFTSIDESTVESSSKRYVVPFVMCANYDIEDEYIEKTSLNYLQTILFEKAGLDLTPYQEYLSDLRKELPVITQNFIIDNQNNYYSLKNEAETPHDDLLNMYEAMQYNHLFGKKKINGDFFGFEEEGK